MKTKNSFDIDNSVKERMSILDNLHSNFFSKDLSLIIDFAPYRDKIVHGKPMRMLEHYIVYVDSGQAEMEISLNEIDLRRGSLLVVPKGTTVTMLNHSGNYSPMTLAFDIPMADSQNLMPSEVLTFLLADDEREIIKGYLQMIDRVIKEQEKTPIEVDFITAALLYHINILHENITQLQGNTKEPRTKSIYKKFMHMLNTMECPMRRVEWYAEEMNISPEYLRAAIKKYSTQSPKQLIDLATVKAAKMLLTYETKLSIKEISEKLQYTSAAQFIKFFKQQTGETPLDYRKSIKR